MKRKEHAPVLLEGLSVQIEVEVLICNRCGAKALAQHARDLAWVHVGSDGRGGTHLDFCGPAHTAEYFRELIPPSATSRPALALVVSAATAPDPDLVPAG
jgi:hypothetical protein